MKTGRKKVKIGDEDSLKAVRKRVRACKDGEEANRLHAIRLAHSGEYNYREIAEILGIAQSTVGLALRRWREGKIAGLATKKRGGAQQKSTKIDGETASVIFAGLKEGRWKTAKEIHKFVKNRGGKAGTITFGGFCKWLKRNKIRKKSPRKSPAKKDEKKSKEFRDNFLQKLHDLHIIPFTHTNQDKYMLLFPTTSLSSFPLSLIGLNRLPSCEK